MKGLNWYPAATLSAFLLSCGGTTADDNGGKPGSTGGNSVIDSGVPAATGGMPMAFYGMRMFTGGTPSFGGAIDAGLAGGATGGIDSYTGGQSVTAPATGIYLYGPRFDKLESASMSSGGNHAVISSDAEGGANLSNQRFDP